MDLHHFPNFLDHKYSPKNTWPTKILKKNPIKTWSITHFSVIQKLKLWQQLLETCSVDLPVRVLNTGSTQIHINKAIP